MVTFIIGPSASGKGTRIKRYIDYLDSFHEAEVWERSFVGRKDSSKTKTRDIGRFYKEENVFILGYFSKDGKTWQSLDHICTFDLSPLFEELYEKGIDIVCDLNSTLVNAPTIPRFTLGTSSLEVIYFYHKDKEEALRRINKRRESSNKPVWSLEDLDSSSVGIANNKAQRLFLRNDFSEKFLVEATEDEDWLIDFFNNKRGK